MRSRGAGASDETECHDERHAKHDDECPTSAD